MPRGHRHLIDVEGPRIEGFVVVAISTTWSFGAQLSDTRTEGVSLDDNIQMWYMPFSPP